MTCVFPGAPFSARLSRIRVFISALGRISRVDEGQYEHVTPARALLKGQCARHEPQMRVRRSSTRNVIDRLMTNSSKANGSWLSLWSNVLAPDTAGRQAHAPRAISRFRTQSNVPSGKLWSSRSRSS